jgi:tRNA U54 and U55 pseudouridine synthase Pus10
MFLDDFDILILKIKKNLRKYYFNTFSIEKHFWKNMLHHDIQIHTTKLDTSMDIVTTNIN